MSRLYRAIAREITLLAGFLSADRAALRRKRLYFEGAISWRGSLIELLPGPLPDRRQTNDYDE